MTQPLPSTVASTPSGKLEGTLVGGAARFLGIRYATCSRFGPPEPAPSWSGLKEVSGFGPACPQRDLVHGQGVRAARSARALRLLGIAASEPIENEDCLFLNVWTTARPSDGTSPVLVWLHGHFATGSGAAPWTDGTSLARDRGLVVVTVNHRLSVFGHFCGDDGEGRNAGILDIIEALRWVREHISAFGGDPGNVTLAGVSAGALRAACAATSPLSRGLVHRVALHSPIGVRPISLEESQDRSHRFAELLRTTTSVPDPRTADTRALVEVAAASPHFLPVADGVTVEADPMSALASGSCASLPTIIGITRDEGFTFVPRWGDEPWTEDVLVSTCRREFGEAGLRLLEGYRRLYRDLPLRLLAMEFVGGVLFRRPVMRFVEARGAVGDGGALFAYEFCAPTGFVEGRPRTPHGFDVPFVFGNLPKVSIARSVGSNRQLADSMSGAWARFATTGDTSSPDVVWPAYELHRRRWLAIGPDDTDAVDDPRSAEREALARAGELDGARLLS